MSILSKNDIISVQAIMMCPLKNMDCLSFDHSCNLDVFPGLDPTTISSHLIALLYEVSDNKKSKKSFELLENLLKDENGQYRIGIFNEPSCNFGNIYLIGHAEDSAGLGCYIKNAKLALFQFSYQDILGTSVKNYLQYIHEYSAFNSATSNSNRAVHNLHHTLSVQIDQLKSNFSKLSMKNSKLQTKNVTARNIIRSKSLCLEGTISSNHFQCIKCKNNQRNVLFLPCGDLAVCKECLIYSMKIPLNCIIKKSKFQCPKCDQRIDQAKEILI